MYRFSRVGPQCIALKPGADRGRHLSDDRYIVLGVEMHARRARNSVGSKDRCGASDGGEKDLPEAEVRKIVIESGEAVETVW